MPKVIFAKNNDYVELPKSAKWFLPNWYKESKKFLSKKNTLLSPKSEKLLGVKACVPFADAMMFGYMAQTGQDIQVVQRDGHPDLRWPVGSYDILSARDGLGSETLPVPAGHYPYHFVWRNLFSMKMPKGYVAMFTHPLNRHDLPFTTLTGIIDGGTTLHPGQFPFFLKEGFEGVIPKGTPMFQIIPIKLETWKAQYSQEIIPESDQNARSAQTSIYGWYRHFVWQKKEFLD